MNLVTSYCEIQKQIKAIADLKFFTMNPVNDSVVERFRINSDGTAGIGTTTPSVMLQISEETRREYSRPTILTMPIMDPGINRNSVGIDAPTLSRMFGCMPANITIQNPFDDEEDDDG